MNEPQGEVRLIIVGPPQVFTCPSALRQVEIPVTPKHHVQWDRV